VTVLLTHYITTTGKIWKFRSRLDFSLGKIIV
jgi:hypothetical protein